MTVTEHSRRELAAFLRSRRERLRPEEIGLSGGGRRRTPGLRREEVARLADVGVTWYTWLEQGREINASESVLMSIARALRLDASERDHVLTLAGVPVSDRAESQPPYDEADDVTAMLLTTLEPFPAAVLSARYDYLAYNNAVLALFGDYATLPPERRNSLWLCFTEPRIRRIMVDWELEMPHSVALFRGTMAEHIGEPAWEAIVDELCTVSDEFRAIWADRRVAEPEPRVKKFLHPEVGYVRFMARSYWLAPRRSSRLVVYAPTDDETEKAMRRLVNSGRPWFTDWSELARYGAAALRQG